MPDPTAPMAWANALSRAWGPRFPVNVRQIASEYSARFRDPVVTIKAADVDTFEGALYKMKKKNGWAILYNPKIRSAGRINFTLGHEFGHYLVHREAYPDGFVCGSSDALGMARTNDLGKVEREADVFSSYLLMPLDDFRRQVGSQTMSADLLRHCADRYEVSFTAAALKWLEATNECAAVVVSINGFVLWCRRSASAAKVGIFFRKGMELHPASMAARGDIFQLADSIRHAPGVWGPRVTREVAIFADAYEMAISLLMFEESASRWSDWREEEPEDSFDRISSSARA